MSISILPDGEPAPNAPVSSVASRGWRDELWAAVVAALDGALRSYYDIVEFSDDPNCVLRIGRSTAERPVMLSDGTEIGIGEPIGTLHFWNEQLPPFPPSGPEMRWAAEMHRRVVCSFAELARFIEYAADWNDVLGFRGEAALSSRIGDAQLRRVTHHFGLEPIGAPHSVLRQLHEFGECFSAWGLTRVYNPAALSRQRFFRRYQELWISRTSLIARYGPQNPGVDRTARLGDGEVLRWPHF